MPNALIGGMTTLVGVSLLFASWDERIARRFWPTTIAWTLLVVSVYLWSRAGGAEFGTTLAILAPALVAWLYAIRNAEVRQRNDRQRTQRSRSDAPVQEKEAAGPRSLPRHLLLFFLTVPLCAAAAAMVSVAVGTMLPWSQVNEMVLSLAIMPILWGCAAYWILADRKLLRPVLSISAAGLSCSRGNLPTGRRQRRRRSSRSEFPDGSGRRRMASGSGGSQEESRGLRYDCSSETQRRTGR